MLIVESRNDIYDPAKHQSRGFYAPIAQFSIESPGQCLSGERVGEMKRPRTLLPRFVLLL